jgi:hypothetical protein
MVTLILSPNPTASPASPPRPRPVPADGPDPIEHCRKLLLLRALREELRSVRVEIGSHEVSSHG